MSDTISSRDNRKPAADHTWLLGDQRGPAFLLSAFTCLCVGVLLLVHAHMASLMSAFTAPARPVFVFFLATIPMQMALVVTGSLCGGGMLDTRIAIRAIGIAFSLVAFVVAAFWYFT